MNIADMFRNTFSTTPAVNPNIPQQQPGQFSAQQPPGVTGDPFQPGTNPSDPPKPPPTQLEQAPLVDYKDLFNIEKPANGVEPFGPLKFAIDPTKVNQAAGQLDFTKSLSPELLSQINKGGPEAMSAMLTAMNVIGQQAFAQAAMAGAKVTESAIEAGRNNIKGELPSLVRSHNINSALREDNPLFSNPATQPMLEMLADQMQRKFPNATPQEIQNHARKYLVDFSSEVGKVYTDPKAAAKAKANSSGDIDWSLVPI